VEEAERLACREDLQCWGGKAIDFATFNCTKPVEKLAQFQFEWTDGWLERKFSHFRWFNKEEGIVTVIGDKIKMQNGFGAWSPMVYECDVDPVNEVIMNDRIQPGRI